jgi:multidrug efflux system membrane fusion protein
VIGPDETVQTRPVTISQISEGRALVDSGVEANEKIVAEGQYRLVAGTHVRELQGEEAQQADLQSSVEQEIP